MEQLFRERIGESDGLAERASVVGAAYRDLISQAVVEWTERARRGARLLMKEGMGMDGWIQDVRFGVRTLAKRPGFTLAAVITLALGIAGNVSMFGVVNGVLLSPLPYPDSDRLVVLWNQDRVTGERDRSVDHPDVRTIQQQIPTLALAGYAGTRPTLTGFGDPTVLFGSRVTDGLIDLMGLQPALGRDLNAGDDIPGGPQVVVVSHAFWTERLGADSNVLGRTITLGGAEWEIVGVGPAGFDYPGGSELWLPRRHEIDGCGHGCRIMSAVGRVSAEGTIHAIQERLDAVAIQLSEEFENTHRDGGFALQPMLEEEVSGVRNELWVLLGAVGMVLLIACANVANLMLVRASARRDEVALRVTLGAGRFRIVRQLLTESALLSLAAGVLGVTLAHWGTTALVALAPQTLPRLNDLTLDPVALAFAAFLVFAVTALFGILPALHLSQRVDAANSGSQRVAGARQAERSRSLLLVAEVALSLTLLLGTGLLVRTLGEIRAVELGFETENVERFRISLPDARYDSLQIWTFLERMEGELTSIPGVRAAGWGFGVPLASGSITTSINFLDQPDVPEADRQSVEVRPSSPGFLDATGTRLVRGRWFNGDDRYGTPGVAVINEAAVRRFYPDRDPIGLDVQADVSWSFEATPPLTIVGIVGDVIRTSPTEAPAPALYLPNSQFGANTGYFSLRLESGVSSAIPGARRVIADLDPSLAIWNTTNMEDVVTDARSTTAFYAMLLSAFSLVALVLATVGLYGVVAYAVAQRTREIGIRIALGAASDDVVGMIVKQGIRPAVVGIAIGLTASWFGARLLSTMLYGVTPQDPITLVTVTVALLAVVVAATVLPARRASTIPPSAALRAD